MTHTGIQTQYGVVHADLLAWIGDNKEQNLVGGWRGNIVCRHCNVSLRDVDAPLVASLRNYQDHERLLQRMEREGVAVGHRQGVNGRSFLSKLPNFDLIEQLAQDHVMHDELEGI